MSAIRALPCSTHPLSQLTAQFARDADKPKAHCLSSTVKLTHGRLNPPENFFQENGKPRMMKKRSKLDDGWPESEKDVFQAALRMVVVKDSR